jgi:tripartite-type tricarboxylate transporter receptor subunit TctC
MLALVALAVLPAALPGGLWAADFAGERIDWIIPFSEGGGSDTWARFFAPQLSKALPGQPVVVVKNIPGGGSTIGANQFQSRARPDGLTILGTSGSTQFPYLLEDRRVKYEYKDWIPVMASPTGGVVYVAPDLGIKSAAEMGKLKGMRLLYGSQGATSLDLVPLLAFQLLELEVKAVFGMKGRGEGRLAFERGEMNIDYQTSSAYLTKVVPLIEAGKAVPMFSWGALDDDGNLVRDPTFPDLPHFAEVYAQVMGKKPAGQAFDAWKAFFISGFAAQKLVFLPKGTPDDIVAAYRAAFSKVISRPGFMQEAEQVLGSYEQAVGRKAEVLVRGAIHVDAGARKWVRTWLEDKYSVKF